ncbi:hypothetical protein HYFRA_00012715 [Hymenoscyphus fraxineus]|uniref:DUF654-domain-containing protein n=1 Tax=Hymenoscyphus fraxineus TaxID=746836 RepID=A0A9N9LAL7_9HELO|nr:hypothetical protein HYFRA_00012715 [Hymenoscyphus fraxineus]
MSSRQLRKLQQQKELELAQAKLKAQEEEEEEEESDDEPVHQPPSKASLFANLAALEDNDDDPDEAKDSEKEEEDKAQDLSEPEPTTIAPPKKAKKSKKKKKKAKAKEKEQPPKPENGEDEIEAALKELDLKKPSGSGSSNQVQVDPEYERICALLGINAQHLKVANEMRNLFGRAAVEVHDDPGGPVGRGARRRQQRGQNQQVDLETALKGRHAPGKGLPEVTLRRNCLMQGKDDWPKAPTGGLTLVIVDDLRKSDGTVEFRFDHNQQYQLLQQTFQQFVEMGDPQNLIGLLIRNPYHISLLIQVSKIAKDQTDHALSADLLERALFTFGRAATTLFNTQLSAGKARLDFSRPENREVWLAGYQYIKSLVMKGTYRTALEWAKLLLSLDPEDDPYCMRFMVHHLALRAGEFNWLLDLFESHLPELWGHSTAIAHIKPSLALAAMSLKEGVQCRKLLTESMKTVPWLYTRLFKELNLDAPPSIWGIEARSEAEILLTEIYVLQTKDLWNTPGATSLLMEIAHTIPKVGDQQIDPLDNSAMTLSVVRYVYLDNTPSLMALAPSHLLHRSNNSDSDPLPPDTNIFSYESQRLTIEGLQRPDGMGGDFYNLPAALMRLIPGLRNPNAAGADLEDPEEAQIRRELEEAIAGDDDGREATMPVPLGLVRRVLGMIWPGDERAAEEYLSDLDDEEEGDEWDSDTETDVEMPELVAQDGDGGEGTDDEMPGLVPA